MKKHPFIRMLATIMVLALMMQMVPLQILAAEETTSSLKTSSARTEDVQVVEEITEKRTEYTKQFRLSNGLHMAVVYPDAVHYEKNGQWKEIDNTLTTKDDGSYSNTAGIWDVQFPRQLSSQNSIVITKDGYTLSFSLEGELKTEGTKLHAESTEETLQTSAAQSATAAVIAVDTDALRENIEYPETIAERNYSRLSYEQVFTNTNIQYDLQANTVKESIVLKAHDPRLRGYCYRLNVGQMIPVLSESGQIDFYDANRQNIIMSMPAPYMVDAAGEYCDDVQVQLVGKGSTYVLTYTLSQTWLSAEERAWPVIVDPVVNADLSRSNIEDRTVAQSNEKPESWGMNACGYSAKYGVHRCYLQYLELPTLTSSDVILGATISQNKAYASSTITTVEVHKVTEPWRSANITWSDKPGFNPQIEDYAIVDPVGWYSWDVTDIVRDWYANENSGMMFKASDAIETGGIDNFKQFLSENFGTAENRPQLEIIYRNNNGLESYWDYTSASAGRAGTGYVNTYTGNLVWTRSDLGFGGNRMPVSISHVYNLGDKASNVFGMGYGWRTNFNQRISSTTIDGSKYYIWEDTDGTSHYFYNESYGVFLDEDNLGLTLRSVNVATNTGVTGAKYSITDKMDNVSVFDSNGRLIRLINNQATKSYITVTYTTSSGLLIDKVTDGVGRVYDFDYTSNRLSRIDYYGTTESTSKAHVAFTYDTNGNLTAISDTDDEESAYEYGADHVLSAAEDIDGYRLEYSYYAPTSDFQPYRVKKIAESHNEAEGGELNFEYSHNQTTLKDHNGHAQIMQFNNMGNTVSVQDDEGHAQYAEYAINDNGDSGKANQLRLSSKLQNTVANLLTDSSFESGTLWYPAGVYEIDNTISTAQAYQGTKSLCIPSYNNAISETVTIPAGQTYTFSAYVKTQGCGAYLSLGTASSTVLAENSDWTRLEVSYTNPYHSDTYAVARVEAMPGDAGNVYVDCVQLEKAASASRYNLVQNGDFRTASFWSASSGRTTVQNAGAPQLSNDVYQMAGNPTQQNRVTQSIPVSGVQGDNFVLTGWAKGDSAPLPKAKTGENQRRFALIGTFHYTDGTASQEFVASFNPDTNADQSWQYTAQVMVAEKAYDSITVSVAYDYNVNTVYFDGIQLYKEQFGSSYTYDDEGNVTSVVDLQKQQTTYEYTDNDLTKAIMPDGATYTYTYDNYHNVLTATSTEDLAYAFTYDTYGNNLTVSVSDGSNTISTSATYTADRNRMATATNSLGKVTTYEYNPDTNMLDWVQYPEDKENWDNGKDTRTYYTYDEMCRPERIYATTDTDLDMSVDYTYTDDYLTKVETPTTAYDFTYGDFGLRTSVKIGSRTLAAYRYTNDKNMYLAGLDYGNGDSVNYTYDEKGRLICQTYEDGDTVTYQYDNDGALASMTDSATGITTRYFYDFIGRAVKYTETGTDYFHSVEYTYDQKNNLSSQIEVINGTTHTTSYEYDDDNRITSKTTDGITVEYTYDGLGSVTQQVTKNGDTTVKTETYTFNENSAQVATYRTQAGGYDVTYTYTYDDNGNILTVNDGTTTTSYVYDSANQLIEAYDTDLEYAWFWTYDNAGNIQSAVLRDYTQCIVDAVLSSHSYTYGDDEWGDLLTAFDGTSITYDGIGNPTSYRGYTLTWEHGRQLASMSQGNQTWEFTYDANGMRTGRKMEHGNQSYSYVYNGDQLVEMDANGIALKFTYDTDGTPLTLQAGDDLYYYVTNLQGDITGILDTNGNLVASYIYDAWGRILSMTGSGVVGYNPLTYRGYVYDFGTGLYYLQSRYYDPISGRFLNADAFASTGQGLTGNNMFAYCGNNPVNNVDPTGETETTTIPGSEYWWLWWLGLIDGLSPVVNVVVAGACCLFGFAKFSNKALKQNPQEDKLDSGDIDWKGNDKNRQNHIIKGTDNKHVPGWQKMGIDPNGKDAWAKVLPILKEVIDKGQLVNITLEKKGFIFWYEMYYVEKGVKLVVKVFVDFATKKAGIVDGIPYIFK